MRFAELDGAKVAVWGYGREGRSVLAALRRRYPSLPLTLYCQPDEAAVALARGDSALRVSAAPPDADALATNTVVVKSPGISAYKPEILAARERGTRFTSGTALWFAENPDARVAGITGTKGKSTTTALLAHLARALGVRTALAGNIGLPLLELDGQHADLWTIELSSFQTGEAGPLELGAVVSLGEEHLDWHGSVERYVTDKLKLADVSRTLLVDAETPALMQRTARHPHRVTFGDTGGWHVAAGAIVRGGQRVFEVAALPLKGTHNAHNACAALAALEWLGLDAQGAAPALATFKPLPHRLTALGRHAGIDWVDDSISTTPDAALAALESLPGRKVTLILGGHDRGLDWTHFATVVHAQPPQALVVQGAAGPRIAATLHAVGGGYRLAETNDLEAAVARAKALTPPDGVVLLSPGAPSFDQFRNYVERGRTFARLAGLEGDATGEITGLGIA
ncbi:MAG: UDP-N-acetylmuramoyl-L-alanine--D-glutamate ligase [Rhodanobacteraceae bacterium]|nr:MAG: UDP-N-acetylmuramoyl-L-alanine--D-glutamate ligase [Rhodanobacteraceae bacterium]